MKRACAAVMIGFALCAARGETLPSHPISAAVRAGDCTRAVTLVRKGVSDHDVTAIFLGGRMIDEGICVKPDPEGAVAFFKAASEQGLAGASFEYAAKVGLGQGGEQNYEQAGHLCRAAGLDPQAQVSDYTLGYVCTLNALAGRRLRLSLPPETFKADGTALSIGYDAATAKLEILSAPGVRRERDAPTGYNLAKRKIDTGVLIPSIWSKAVNQAPPPDKSRLDAREVVVSMDFDAFLEVGYGVEAKSEDGSPGLSSSLQWNWAPMGMPKATGP